MNKTLILCAAVVALFAVGCTPTEATPDANKSASGAPDTKMAGTAADMAKCDMCGTEVAKAGLMAHDGKMVCAACDAKAHSGK